VADPGPGQPSCTGPDEIVLAAPAAGDRSYPMCGLCWDVTRQVAQARRPGLISTDTTRAPAL
jgi:hypothetical protein